MQPILFTLLVLLYMWFVAPSLGIASQVLCTALLALIPIGSNLLHRDGRRAIGLRVDNLRRSALEVGAASVAAVPNRDGRSREGSGSHVPLPDEPAANVVDGELHRPRRRGPGVGEAHSSVGALAGGEMESGAALGGAFRGIRRDGSLAQEDQDAVRVGVADDQIRVGVLIQVGDPRGRRDEIEALPIGRAAHFADEDRVLGDAKRKNAAKDS